MQIHYVDQKLPFDTRKDVVIIGRGSQTCYKYIFDLNRLNVFFLNFSPKPLILDIYKREFSDEIIGKSLFSFVHANHLQQLIDQKKINGNIVTWKGDKIKGVMVQNCLPTCADWLGKTLKNKNIYLVGLDFDQDRRDFTAERDGLKAAINQNGVRLNEPYDGKNKYIFLTPNRHFHLYMNPEQVFNYVQALKKNGLIIKEVI